MAPSPPPAGLRLPDASDCELSDLSSATGMAVASASIVTASSERARARRPETAGNESLSVMVRWLFTGHPPARQTSSAVARRAAASFAGNSRAGRACPTRLTGTSEGTGAAQISCGFSTTEEHPFPAEIISLVAFHGAPRSSNCSRCREVACARSSSARSSQRALPNRNRHSDQLCDQPAPPDLGVARHRPRCSLLRDQRPRAAWRTLVDLALPARLLRARTYPPSSGESLPAVTGAHPSLTGALAWQGDAS